MNWICNNKEWLLSGAIPTAIAILVSLAIVFFSKNKSSKSIKSGKNSTNIQIDKVDGNITVPKEKKDD